MYPTLNLHGAFAALKRRKDNFELFRIPFDVNVDTASVQIQMELIELQFNGTLKAKYGPVRSFHT